MFGGIDDLAEGLLVWLLEGVLVGYAMGFFASELNDDSTIIGDIGAGVAGAVAGGFTAHYFVAGSPGFALSMAVAAACATALTAAWRLAASRRVRVP